MPTTAVVPETPTETPNSSVVTVSEPFSSASCFGAAVPGRVTMAVVVQLARSGRETAPTIDVDSLAFGDFPTNTSGRWSKWQELQRQASPGISPSALTHSDPRHVSPVARLNSSQACARAAGGALRPPATLYSWTACRRRPSLTSQSPPARRVPPCQEEQLACAPDPAGLRDRCTAPSSIRKQQGGASTYSPKLFSV